MIPAETYHFDQLLKQDTIELLAMLSTEEKAQVLDILFNVALCLPELTIQGAIVQNLNSLKDLCGQAKWPFAKQKPTNPQKVMIYLVLTYKIVENKYDSEGDFIQKVYEIIRETKKYRQVQGGGIVNRLKSLRNRTNSQFVQLLRLLPISEKQSQQFKNGLQKRQDLFAHEAIEHQLKRLYQNQFKKKGKIYPRLAFEKLNSVQSESITIFFSGLGSEKTCKLTEWEQMIKKVKTEAYAIRWQSKSFEDMFEYGKQQVLIPLIADFAMEGWNVLQRKGKVKQVLEKSKVPFNQAFEMSNVAGQFLGELFAEHLQGYNIVLVGFSLGTELIRNIMKRMQGLNALNILKEVILLGGVADHREIERILEKTRHQLLIYNFYNNNDSVLKHLLWLCKSQLNPVGLNRIRQIKPHTIVNQDCSDYVEGHGDYRRKLSIITDYTAFIYS